MAKIDLPRYMRAKKLASGKVSYFWEPPHWARPPASRNGRPCPVVANALGQNIAQSLATAEQLNEALDTWREGAAQTTTAIGTVAWLFEWYRGEEVFTKNAAKTQNDYRKLMNAVVELPMRVGTFGDRLASKVTAEVTEELYKRFKPKGERQAVYMVQVCRAVWNWANRFPSKTGISTGENPFAGMRKGYKPKRGNRPTNRQEYEGYCAKARELGLDSMATAAMLCFELVQRVSDAFGFVEPEKKGEYSGEEAVRGIRWEDYKPGLSFTVFQAKTGKRLTIPLVDRMPDGESVPLYPELEEQLARIRPASAKGLIVIEERTGNPYKERRVSTVHRRICDAAGLPNTTLADM